jgi:hypothetical protein
VRKKRARKVHQVKVVKERNRESVKWRGGGGQGDIECEEKIDQVDQENGKQSSQKRRMYGMEDNTRRGAGRNGEEP